MFTSREASCDAVIKGCLEVLRRLGTTADTPALLRTLITDLVHETDGPERWQERLAELVAAVKNLSPGPAGHGSPDPASRAATLLEDLGQILGPQSEAVLGPWASGVEPPLRRAGHHLEELTRVLRRWREDELASRAERLAQRFTDTASHLVDPESQAQPAAETVREQVQELLERTQRLQSELDRLTPLAQSPPLDVLMRSLSRARGAGTDPPATDQAQLRFEGYVMVLWLGIGDPGPDEQDQPGQVQDERQLWRTIRRAIHDAGGFALSPPSWPPQPGGAGMAARYDGEKKRYEGGRGLRVAGARAGGGTENATEGGSLPKALHLGKEVIEVIGPGGDPWLRPFVGYFYFPQRWWGVAQTGTTPAHGDAPGGPCDMGSAGLAAGHDASPDDLDGFVRFLVRLAWIMSTFVPAAPAQHPGGGSGRSWRDQLGYRMLAAPAELALNCRKFVSRDHPTPTYRPGTFRVRDRDHVLDLFPWLLRNPRTANTVSVHPALVSRASAQGAWFKPAWRVPYRFLRHLVRIGMREENAKNINEKSDDVEWLWSSPAFNGRASWDELPDVHGARSLPPPDQLFAPEAEPRPDDRTPDASPPADASPPLDRPGYRTLARIVPSSPVPCRLVAMRHWSVTEDDDHRPVLGLDGWLGDYSALGCKVLVKEHVAQRELARTARLFDRREPPAAGDALVAKLRRRLLGLGSRPEDRAGMVLDVPGGLPWLWPELGRWPARGGHLAVRLPEREPQAWITFQTHRELGNVLQIRLLVGGNGVSA